MQLTVVGRHFEVTEPIKQYVDKKLLRLERFASKIKEAHVILEVQKIRHIAEITLYLKYSKLTATEETQNMYASIDNAVANLRKQLVRLRDRIKTSRTKGAARKVNKLASSDSKEESVESEPELAELGLNVKGVKVIKRFISPKPMSTEEACLELDLFKERFIVFRDAVTDKINVVYKREDGNYGLIVPE